MSTQVYSLALYFTGDERPQLYKIVFANRLGEQVTALRGKSGGLHGQFASFQWTSAVRALSALALKAALYGVSAARLEGGRGSLASALDFAIGKPPRWLRELLSADKKKALHFFRRSNSECKLPGPVVVGFNPTKFSESSFKVFVSGEPIEGMRLRRLLDTLEGSHLCTAIDLRGRKETYGVRGEESFDTYFKDALSKEAWSSLARVKITSTDWCNQQVRYLSKDTLFQQLTEDPQRALELLGDFRVSRDRYGVVTREIVAKHFPNGIRILCAICQPGLIALATYLQQRYDIPVYLDPYHLYGTELSSRVIGEGESDLPTLVSFGLGAASPFLNNRKYGYSLFMLGPALDHKILEFNQEKTTESRTLEYRFTNAEPTSAQFNFNVLKETGFVSRQHKAIHTEPDTILDIAKNGLPFSSLIWFPYTALVPKLLPRAVVSEAKREPYLDFTLMLANKRITSDQKLKVVTKAMIHDAWLTLLESPKIIGDTTDRIVRSEEFISYVRRSLGCHYLVEYGAHSTATATTK